MHSQKVNYHSQLYREFLAIDSQAYHSQIRFYERQEEEILRLEEDEFFELMTTYTRALFLVGAYQKFLLMAEAVIAQTMARNIQFYQGEDLFLTTLYRKAYAHFRLMQFDQADYVLRQILRIEPEDANARKLLQKVLYHSKPDYVLRGRALSVLCFLIAALLSALHLVFIRHFYLDLEWIVVAFRNTFFLSGIATLIGVDLWHRGSIRREIRVFLEEIRAEKDREARR